MIIVARVGSYYGLSCEWVDFHHVMWLDALMVGALGSRFRLTSVPRFGFKVSWLHVPCDIGFLPSSGSGSVVECLGGKVPCVLPDGVYSLRNWGWGHVLLVLGLWVTGW